MAAERFLDTDVLLHLLSADHAKADRAEEVISEGGVVSVQVLNEFASVATRKLGLSIADARHNLEVLRAILRVEAVTVETHETGLDIAERHRLSLHDAMIVASARLAGCETILSEDMHHGARLEGIVVRNPFR